MKKILFVVLATLLLFSSYAHGAYTGQFQDLISSTTVGSSFAATVRVTNSSGTGTGSGTVTLSIDTDYFSTSDSLSKTCSFNGGSTCDVTWTLTAEQAGTKTISAAGTFGSSSTGSITSNSIAISNPTTFSLTFTDNDADNALDSGQQVTTTLTVQNTGAAGSATADLSLTGFTVSSGSDPASLGTISENGQASYSWVLTHDGSTTSPRATVSVTGGDTASASLSFTYTAAATTTTTGGGGGAAEKKKKGAKGFDKIPAGVGLRNNTKLQAAIEKVLAKGKMNENAINNLLQLSAAISGSTQVNYNFTAAGGKSTFDVKVKYKGDKKAKNYIVYHSLPKTFALNANNITVNAPKAVIEIVESDPSYIFKYGEVAPNEELAITYTVNSEVDAGVIDLAAIEVYAESLETKEEEKPSVVEEIKETAKKIGEQIGERIPEIKIGGKDISRPLIILVTIVLVILLFILLKPKKKSTSEWKV